MQGKIEGSRKAKARALYSQLFLRKGWGRLGSRRLQEMNSCRKTEEMQGIP